jgi:hypothetical protein
LSIVMVMIMTEGGSLMKKNVNGTTFASILGAVYKTTDYLMHCPPEPSITSVFKLISASENPPKQAWLTGCRQELS